jgi:hypothetical protein
MQTLEKRQEETKKERAKLYGLTEECYNLTLYDLEKLPPKENYIDPTEYDLKNYQGEV